MQHLEDYFGHKPAVVKLCFRWEPPLSDLLGHRWTNHTGRYEQFLDFPERFGWAITDHYKLKRSDSTSGSMLHRQEALLQAWIFFDMIFAVLRDGGGPILRFHDLVTDNNRRGVPRQLNTAKKPMGHSQSHCLNDTLLRWKTYFQELSYQDSAAAKIHMAHAEFILQFARKVVVANCSIFGNAPPYSTVEQSDEYMSDVVALSLMVLGETLSSAKADLLNTIRDLRIDGWHTEDDHEGWGPSRYVFKKLSQKKWCARTVHVLQGQVKAHATLMYTAWLSKEAEPEGKHHECSPEECKYRSGTVEKYETAHSPTCSPDSCKMIGLDMGKVLDILDNHPNSIPLAIITEADYQISIDVEAFDCDDDGSRDTVQFASVSHVWADGWANPTGNGMPSCQLHRLKMILSKTEKDPITSGDGTSEQRKDKRTRSMPFWFDTLLIPVITKAMEKELSHDELNRRKRLRDKAIGQIPDIFDKSRFTVVLDSSLLEASLTDEVGHRAQVSLMVLTSTWMKRLWTLQEAYLSKEIYIPFTSTDGLDIWPRAISEVLESLENGDMNVISTANFHLRQSLMYYGSRREAGNTPSAYTIMVDFCNAAQWRATQNPAHEYLGLATLLGLNYKNSRLDRIGRLQDKQTREKLDQLAREFWSLFVAQYSHQIPSGLIFLPGAKLEIRGLGWAPRTFLRAMATPHPDPLPRIDIGNSRGAHWIEGQGLCVQYPGFILHCDNHPDRRKRILLANMLESSFSFPTDPRGQEWYTVKAITEPAETSMRILMQKLPAQKQTLAIILTQSNPKPDPPEIGLLVVKTGEGRIIDPKGPSAKECISCQVIRRVYVSRGAPESPCRSGSQVLRFPNCFEIIGENVRAEQNWLVDRYSGGQPQVTAQAGNGVFFEPRNGVNRKDGQPDNGAEPTVITGLDNNEESANMVELAEPYNIVGLPEFKKPSTIRGSADGGEGIAEGEQADTNRNRESVEESVDPSSRMHNKLRVAEPVDVSRVSGSRVRKFFAKLSRP